MWETIIVLICLVVSIIVYPEFVKRFGDME